MGKEISFNEIDSYADFKNRIPIQDYNSIKHDILRTQKGLSNIMWPSEIRVYEILGTTQDKSKFIL